MPAAYLEGKKSSTAHAAEQELCLKLYPSLLFSSVRATPIPADTESQLSSRSDDQSDSRTEHSDEDVADKAPKRTPSVRATKKPAAAKTEVYDSIALSA